MRKGEGMCGGLNVCLRGGKVRLTLFSLGSAVMVMRRQQLNQGGKDMMDW